MLSHFEFIGLVFTIQAKLEEYDRQRQIHLDNSHMKDLTEDNQKALFVKAQLCAGRMEGLLAALDEIHKLQHSEK